jgi:hypothetical protein
MIKAITTCDAAILVPNKEHKNFTDTGKVIPKNTKIIGNPTIIKGLRRGQPFDYKLFITDKNEFIYLKTIQTMNATEVLLGADASTTPTVVKMPNDSNLGMRPVIGTILGGILGYYYAKKKNSSKVMMFTAVGAVAGFAAGKYLQGTGVVLFKKSK